MGILLGSLGIKDSERPFMSVTKRRIIWDATEQLFARYNQELSDARQLFVQESTHMNTERYELAGGGEAEALPFEETDMQEVKRTGSWDVAYPIWVSGSKISYHRVGLAYLTMGQYESVVQTVFNRSNTTNFRRILSAIFKNTTTTFKDPTYGSLTIQTLANNDAIVYPPKIGATTETTENYYLAASYVTASISNTNNPFVTIRDAIEPRYGFAQGGSPIIALVPNSMMQYVRQLADFDATPYHNVEVGDNVSVPSGFPADRFLPSNARVEGVADGCWIVSWPRMPADTLIGIHADAPPPLKFRTDDVDGLGGGELQLLADDPEFPFKSSRWIQRGGYGVGNRIGAVVMRLNGTGTYDIPTGFSTLE